MQHFDTKLSGLILVRGGGASTQNYGKEVVWTKVLQLQGPATEVTHLSLTTSSQGFIYRRGEQGGSFLPKLW